MAGGIDRIDVRVCRVPTEHPQSDGTATWDATTIVIAEVRADGATGLGYSYVTGAAAAVIEDVLAPALTGLDADAIPAAATRMVQAVRNDGRQGIAACAISAVDVALWDLKARRLGVSVATLLGPARTRVPVYASGGFTSTPPDALAREIADYAARGYQRVKIKIGRERDPDRLRVLADCGAGMGLMVDANGAYTVKQALAIADLATGVEYFEEPVSSDDLAGLARVREHAAMAIAAGEYGYSASYYRGMIDAVDIVQCDATRCLGITGFIEVAALCTARSMPLSAHCAPALHAQPACALGCVRHIEYFHDHARIESMLFEGAQAPTGGAIAPDRSRPGLGLDFRRADAARFAL
jgi:L-alanine-DL-glutamate epimerase-like enolase superfamily enzyme